jgi:hypothetical protein
MYSFADEANLSTTLTDKLYIYPAKLEQGPRRTCDRFTQY